MLHYFLPFLPWPILKFVLKKLTKLTTTVAISSGPVAKRLSKVAALYLNQIDKLATKCFEIVTPLIFNVS